MVSGLWMPLIIICATMDWFEPVDFPVTPDNYREFYGIIPDDVYNLFDLGVAEPMILEPCDTTIWFLGDSAIVSFQGAARFGFKVGNRLIDSTYCSVFLPTWWLRFELYQNGDFIKTGTSDQQFTQEESENPTDNLHFNVRNKPRVDLRDRIYHILPGFGYQIRIILWDGPDPRPDYSDYVEIWSDSFEIAEPWLDVVYPTNNTIWREDSNDVYIEYISHGSFRYSPRVRLFRDGIRVWNFQDVGGFSDGVLSRTFKVKHSWGNGDGYQICLEYSDDRRYFSDCFTIIGQTIEVDFLPYHVWYCDDAQLEIHWTSSSGSTVDVELYRVDRDDSKQFVTVLASSISNEGLFLYENPPDTDWVDGYFRIKIEDSDGNYGWSDVLHISNLRDQRYTSGMLGSASFIESHQITQETEELFKSQSGQHSS